MSGSVLFYDTDSSSGDDLEHFVPEKEPRGPFASREPYSPTASSVLRLPRPRRTQFVPPPPPPIEVIPPAIARTVIEAAREAPEEVIVDVEEFREQGRRFAESHARVRDRTLFNGVGYDRAKSQLTYLAGLDEQTRGEFEDQVGRRTRASAAAKKMYGW
jgi:hypothetical protein